MREAGLHRIEMQHPAMRTMVALPTAAMMSVLRMCCSAIRAVVLKRRATTRACHHKGGKQTEQKCQILFHVVCVVHVCFMAHPPHAP